MDYKRLDLSGTVKDVEFLGIDAMGQFAAFRLSIGRISDVDGLEVGAWAIPVATLRELLPVLTSAVAETAPLTGTKQ